MKKCIFCVITMVFIFALPVHAQDEVQPPFTFTLYGGLFFPSEVHFKDVFHSNSELLYGFGVTLPVASALYVTGDLAFFKAEAFLDTTRDSSIVLEQRFYHLGLLYKQYLGGLLFARITAGFNYVTLKQRVTSSQFAEHSIEAEKKIGYFSGVGLEKMLVDGHASLFCDLIYDYRRSHMKELEGDFGGTRLVLGVHIILFD